MLFFKIVFSNLAEKYDLFKIKYSKSEQDLLNIKDFMAPKVTFFAYLNVLS